MFPTVQLLHTLPDGSSHVDWMLARDPDGAEPLLTFRLGAALHDLAAGQSIDAERIDDHRPAYLAYEGPISGGRGEVRRLASGSVEPWVDDPDGWSVEVCWTTDRDVVHQHLRLDRRGTSWAVAIVEVRTDG